MTREQKIQNKPEGRKQMANSSEDILSMIAAVNDKWERYTEAEDRNETEEITDKLYSDYYAAVRELASTVEKVSGGAIDSKTAGKMAHHKRNELAAIFSRAVRARA